ncbi:MAG: isoprenylcysteine carboxylmethyltransferase family protein [Planctomycetes bacterium]|nr:isoprenylcysteine carboxylmethyltransferase family protein [Planctomycetota bacterium]
MGLKQLDKFRRKYRLLIIFGLFALCLICLELSNVAKTSIIYGVPVIVVGMLIRLWTNGTIVKSKEVCNVGPYSICRHPMYFGTIVASFGVAVLMNQIFFTVIILLAFIISFVRAKSEESKLIERFPEYNDYKSKVPALPTPVSLARSIGSGSVIGRWSLRLSYENGEVTRLNLYYLILVISLMYLKFREKLALNNLYFHVTFLMFLVVSALSFLLYAKGIKHPRYFFVVCMICACIGSFVLTIDFPANL